MRTRCPCGEAHDFTAFKRYPTTWGGVMTFFQHYCSKLGKNMIAVSSTYPGRVADMICPSPKRFRRVITIVESDSEAFFELYGSGDARSP